ncbi:MAG: RNA polymerase sigma factor [Myxococcaceae bacterium]
MAKLAAGDRAQAPIVFNGLWVAVQAFCSHALGDAHADDAAQRALVRVFEQASEFDVQRDVRAWALEIALWECRTELRRRSRSREAPMEAPEVPHVVDERLSPEASVGQRELAHALDSAMAALGEGDRETLRALLSEELPDVPAATWRKRKERALRRLKLVWRSLHEGE